MEYIDAEVRAVCEAKGWGSQIRRKEDVRRRPVSKSPIGDYEWKLIPSVRGRLPDATANDFDGVYYVLSFDEANERFVFQHGTHHVGVWGPHWERSNYTQIDPSEERAKSYFRTMINQEPAREHPPVGWLRDHLLDLVSQYEPNTFSVT